ncbi:MAG: ribosome silencing factor [Bacteroidota bacterium]|nr:ribosome silencing factor [Bacteroidota bacterium]
MDLLTKFTPNQLVISKDGKLFMQKKAEKQDLNHRLEIIIEAIRNLKGHNITDIDIAKLNSTVCRHYIICDAPSGVQVKAISDEIEDQLFDKFQKKALHKEGVHNSIWILLDYADVIVHVFKTEAREFYKLEELWADGIVKKINS